MTSPVHLTPISWCTHTAVDQSGCTKVSEECRLCYALRLASTRLRHHALHGGVAEWNDGDPVWTNEVRVDRERMDSIFLHLERARQSIQLFYNDMSDLWHPAVPTWAHEARAEHIARVFRPGGRAEARRHELYLLTKRPEGLLLWQQQYFPEGLPRGVVAMTTAGTQRSVDKRLPVLGHVKAYRRGVSVEPLLSAVTLWNEDATDPGQLRGPGVEVQGGVTPSTPQESSEGWQSSYPVVDWVIVGGESGIGARPMEPAWARALLDQCRQADVRFHMKQLGLVWSRERGPSGSSAGSNWSELPEDLRIRHGAGSWDDERCSTLSWEA